MPERERFKNENERGKDSDYINNHKENNSLTESKPIVADISGTSTSFSPMTMVTNLMRSSSAEVRMNYKDDDYILI